MLSSSEIELAGALATFQAQADRARREFAQTARQLGAQPNELAQSRLAASYRLEGYLEGYLEALKLAPPQVAAECVPAARSLLQDLAAILVTVG